MTHLLWSYYNSIETRLCCYFVLVVKVKNNISEIPVIKSRKETSGFDVFSCPANSHPQISPLNYELVMYLVNEHLSGVIASLIVQFREFMTLTTAAQLHVSETDDDVRHAYSTRSLSLQWTAVMGQ